MSSKAALKAVRTALDSKDFELAATKAQELVQQEPQNYHAYVNSGQSVCCFYRLTTIVFQKCLSRPRARQARPER